MNPDLDRLQPYPFERLAALFDGVRPVADRAPISLSIGEPAHAPPDFVAAALAGALDGLGRYPATRGSAELREAIADWLQRRFGLDAISADEQVLPVNGTREALFAFAQAVVDRGRDATVVLPNPFYQIYEGAALLAGAEPVYLPTDARGLPDFDRLTDNDWDRCQLLYVCSPGNPTGAVLDTEQLKTLVARAHAHDFVIAADECYSEIHPDEDAPPAGLLQAAHTAGHERFERCMAFHSLSKRSNLPGLRSGFVAGDAVLIERFARYRTYHGCAMPPPAQAASIAAWGDENHVRDNRAAYREKFDRVLTILADALDVARPDGAFYLWPRTPIDDETFARDLLRTENLRVLPGSFLGREVDGDNPGRDHVRIALVPSLDDCVEAAQRIHRFIMRG